MWITDMQQLSAMNEAYRSFFPTDPPARLTLGVPALPGKDAIVEIALTAVK